MKVIICGGREYLLTPDDVRWLDELRTYLPITTVLNGLGGQADRAAHRWAQVWGVPITEFPADWWRFGKGAGPRRNAAMAREAEACLAFPGGPGTRNMIEQAQRLGLHIFLREDWTRGEPLWSSSAESVQARLQQHAKAKA